MARTLLDIKTEAATYFQVSPSAFTINGQDLFLMAANHVRQQAEMAHDLEFLRTLADVTVAGTTGGTLSSATDHVSSAAVMIKTVIEVGLYDTIGNFNPVSWGPVANLLEQQREQNHRYIGPRYPADGDIASYPRGIGQFRLSNNKIFKWPKTETAASESYLVGIECYSLSVDWAAADLAETLTVTGTLSPNATGVYTFVGKFRGFPMWIKDGDTGASYFIYNTGGSKWNIQVGASVFTDTNCWSNITDEATPVGSYIAVAANTGTATVAGSNSTSTSDTWTTYGGQYLLWATIILLNHRFKEFVFRTEGNLPPPQQLRDEGLAAFIEWDTDRYTKFRRESR